MRPPTMILFKDGPLDGIEWRKTVVARPPRYLDENGVKIPPYVGDRIILGRSAINTCYVLDGTQTDRHGNTVTYRYHRAGGTS
jgi:hypothetical protein